MIAIWVDHPARSSGNKDEKEENQALFRPMTA
jgi:hypothetical protein